MYGGDLITICWKEAGTWTIQQTTEYTGNERWNYGLDPRQAHDYQSAVMPPAASECQEPVTMTAPPRTLPAVGSKGDDLLIEAMLFVVAFTFVSMVLILVGKVIRYKWTRRK